MNKTSKLYYRSLIIINFPFLSPASSIELELMFFFNIKSIYILNLWFFLLFFGLKSLAQDLENIELKNPVKVSGSLGTNQIFYHANGINNRRPPYMWILTGILNIDLYGVNIPLSAFWSNQNRQFRQPFNQYGLSPKYKWITVHLGYRNMTFSTYSLSGYTFLGAGVEINPGILRFAAMYGRLNKAVAQDTINHPNEVPAFKRMGYGFKIGVGKEGDFIDFSIFRAKDNPHSIPYVPIDENILPAENLVFSFNGQKKLGKNIMASAEFASSAYTRDIRSEESEGRSVFNHTGTIFQPRTSSQYFNAFKCNVAYNKDKYGIQAGYERIEPEYRTLGSYFFNNDLENYTVSPSLRLLEQRLNLVLNLGIQRNNISGNKSNTTKRTLTSVNLNFLPNTNWNFGVQYSNFTSYNKISQRLNQFQNLDTLNFYQINENANINAGYNLQGSERTQGVNLILSYQTANETYGEKVTSNKVRFYNSNLSYRIIFVPNNLTLTAGLNMNQNNMATNSSTGFGPTASVSKTFFDKKLRTTLLSTYNEIKTKEGSSGQALNLVFNCGYTFLKQHNIGINSIWLNKYARTATGNKFSEFTGTFSYAYNF